MIHPKDTSEKRAQRKNAKPRELELGPLTTTIPRKSRYIRLGLGVHCPTIAIWSTEFLSSLVVVVGTVVVVGGVLLECKAGPSSSLGWPVPLIRLEIF